MTKIKMTIPALHAAYEDGIKPMDVVNQVFDHIAQINDPGIFITLFDRADVLKAAEGLGEFDPSKALWGVPFAIKDNIDAEGYEFSILKGIGAALPEGFSVRICFENFDKDFDFQSLQQFFSHKITHIKTLQLESIAKKHYPRIVRAALLLLGFTEKTSLIDIEKAVNNTGDIMLEVIA